MSSEAQVRARVGIVGAGRYGIALATLIAEQGRDVTLFTSIKQRAQTLTKTRQLRSVLPELERLPDEVKVTSSVEELAADCTLLMMTSSSEFFDSLVQLIGPHLDGAHCVVHAWHSLHGRDLHGGCARIMEHSVVRQVGVIAGPMHVAELLGGRPNVAVVGSAYPLVHTLVRRALEAPHVRIHTSWDRRGVETAAALAQVVALATGLADGLELGAAVHASLLTLGLNQMSRIVERVGIDDRAVMGMAGVGRLIDAIHRNEPNYQLGRALATCDDIGVKLKEAPPDALSLDVLKTLREWSEAQALELPFIEHLSAIIDGEMEIEPGLRSLLRDAPLP